MSEKDIKGLLKNNREWAAAQLKEDPNYFSDLSDQQAPKYLWIGCSDSRVPANVITGLAPGEVFVHRNVSNRVVHEDSNIQTVLQFAIESLKVEHIIVCGHYGCGGVKAGIEGNSHGYVRNWVEPIRRNIIRFGLCRHDFEGPLEDQSLWDRACELNVLHQVRQLRENPFVQDALKSGQKLELHAWIYSLNDGLIRSLG